jgi:hypothetical protein
LRCFSQLTRKPSRDPTAVPELRDISKLARIFYIFPLPLARVLCSGRANYIGIAKRNDSGRAGLRSCCVDY